MSNLHRARSVVRTVLDSPLPRIRQPPPHLRPYLSSSSFSTQSPLSSAKICKIHRPQNPVIGGGLDAFVRQCEEETPTEPESEMEYRRRLGDLISQPTTTPPTEPSPMELLSQQSLSRYWDTQPPSDSNLSFASKFFRSKPTNFLFSTAEFKDLPLESTAPEVVFLGRSNVGKSSLVNALVGAPPEMNDPPSLAAQWRRDKQGNRIPTYWSESAAGDPKRQLARVSHSPGETELMNVYGIGVPGGTKNRVEQIKGGKGRSMTTHERWIGEPVEGGPVGMKGGLVLVDTPGYGYRSRDSWGHEAIKYLTQRKQLRRAFVLINAQHGPLNTDLSILELLRLKKVPHQVILTKVDTLLHPSEIRRRRDPAKNKHRDGKTNYEIFDDLEAELAKLRTAQDELREAIQPKGGIGAAALGEILVCSDRMYHDVRGHKPLGIDGIKWAILQAVGIEPPVQGGGQ